MKSDGYINCTRRCEVSDQFFTSTQMRVMTAEAVVVKMTKYGPVKDDEKTRQLRQMLTQAAEIQERAFSERMCALALGHYSLANKVDRIIIGVDSNGSKAAVAGVDYDPADASEYKEIADSKDRAGIPKVPLVKIIENLVAGDKAKAIDYALHLIGICEDKYKRTGDIFDKYDIMTARNILHTLKGEPKEGGVAVCD